MKYCTCPGWLCCLLLLAAAHGGDTDANSTIGFNDAIRPLLSEHCFACHGPDAASRKGELRLDIRDAAVDRGAIIPGDAVSSELVARITSDDPELLMPPADTGKALTAQERQLLARWIQEGAEYQKHWAFIKPERPDLSEPQAGDDWAVNAIDHFVRRKMQQQGLSPNASADHHVLARRAALDVTGLPPEPELLHRFIADPSDDAWSAYVARLLQSPHAGEHRARFWLDAARYGDTHGMHVDNYREIWPYRDWVIRAFNSNMPFDQFVIEQIAGDLLPDPTQDQLIATGFSRCNITTSEGGAIPAELDVRYMVDRVETTATVFLGLTAGCAVCHDHKYDPISQREFYQLGAFFNNTTTPAMDGNQKDTPPVVTLPSEEFRLEWNELMRSRRELREQIQQTPTGAAEWWARRTESVQHPISPDGLILSYPLTEADQETVALPESATWATEHPAGRRGMRFGEQGHVTAELPDFRTDQPLSVSFWYRTPDRLMSTTLFDYTTETDDGKKAGWIITANTQGGLTFELHDGKGHQIRGKLPGEDALKPRSWQHVSVRYSGGLSNSSINIWVDGRQGVLRNASEDLIEAIDLPSGTFRVATKMPTAGLSDIRIVDHWVTDEEAQLLAQDHALNGILQSKISWDSLDPAHRDLAALYHRTVIDSDYAAALSSFAAGQGRRDFIYSRSTTTLVMQERASAPRAAVLERGEYNKPLEEVTSAVPAVLRIEDDGVPLNGAGQRSPMNRLDLARWLVHPDHPLTARVMVNRLWQSVFGTGLVKSSEDFGVMGERPSHPQLLDWLAVEFVESGWDVDHIMHLILTSSAYRQSAVVTAEKLAGDPNNRLLTRGPRIRLDAEVVRDQALAVSGLLRRTIGGPSVRPYQPDGLWKVVAITGSNTRVFQRDSGDALYRRSVYSFWKRTSPPPSMAAFNAPTREQCTVRRERTNTPMQALVLLNDPQFVECARHLAENAIRTQDKNTARAEWILMTALSHPASGADVVEITAAAEQFLAVFRQKPEAATELIHTGESVPDAGLDPAELAAWTMIANVVMNRDDFINK